MSLSISVPPETESRLRRLASAAGKDTTSYAAELLQDAVRRVESGAIGAISEDQGTSIGERLADVLREIWSIQAEPPLPASNPQEAAFRRSIAEKFRKQGLTP